MSNLQTRNQSKIPRIKRIRIYIGHQQIFRITLSEGLKHLRKPTDIVNDATVMDKDKGMSYWAKERHAANGRWSCVRFDNNFITSSGNPSDSHPQWKPSDPEGKNAHQFVPRIAFGHASYLFNKSQS